MNRRTALSLIVCSVLLNSALGDSFDYDFSGVLSDHFAPIFPNPSSSVSQNDVLEQLEYSTPNGRLNGDNSTGISHLQFQPRYDQSWSAAVDVGLPTSYDNSFLTNNPANQNPDGDSWLEVGIAAIADADADELFVFSLALEPDGVNAVRRILLATDESTGTDNELASMDDSARLFLSFDAVSKELSAFADELLLFSIDLGPGGSNWEMADDDTFRIALFGSTGHQDVSLTEPLTHDNFSALTISGPSTSDFDGDGDVDGFDFLTWQRGETPNPFSAAQLADWEANYGAVVPLSATSTAVPEPATCIVLLIGMTALQLRRHAVAP